MKTETRLAQAKPPEALPVFRAPGIQAKLQEAESKLAESERRYAEAALAAALNEPSTIDHGKMVATRTVERDNDRRRVEELRAAIDGALKRDEAERRRILAEHNKTIIRVCRSHLAARDTAAEKLSAALKDAIEHFKVMVERSAKAKVAVPDWGLQPGRTVEPGELYTLVQKEIARLYGAPPSIDGKCPFPGGDAGPQMKLQPEKLTPLANTLRATTAAIVENLTGKVIE